MFEKDMTDIRSLNRQFKVRVKVPMEDFIVKQSEVQVYQVPDF